MAKLRFKFVAAVAAALVREDGKILVQQRRGGASDNMYMLPTGHVDGREAIAEATARELSEETGLTVDPADLELFHISHSFYEGADELLTFFFRATRWQGDVTNREPDKCYGMQWVDPAQLPEPFFVNAKHAMTQLNGPQMVITGYLSQPGQGVIDLTRNSSKPAP